MAATLLVTLVVVAATPARAEALEPMILIALVSAGLAVLVLVVFLIVASTADSRGAASEDGRMAALSP